MARWQTGFGQSSVLCHCTASWKNMGGDNLGATKALTERTYKGAQTLYTQTLRSVDKATSDTQIFYANFAVNENDQAA